MKLEKISTNVLISKNIGPQPVVQPVAVKNFFQCFPRQTGRDLYPADSDLRPSLDSREVEN